MYKEEKIINGILHYRASPNAVFTPYTLNNLTDKILNLRKEIKQIKCYCGHTTYCDCDILEESEKNNE